MSSSAPLEAMVEGLLHAARDHRGNQFSQVLVDHLNAIAAHPQRHDARIRIAARLADIDSATGAGLLAVWLGAGVEHGLDPEPTAPSILVTMLKWTRKLTSSEENEHALNVADHE